MKKSSTVSSRTLVALWALLAALLVAGAALLIAPPQGYADDPTTVTTESEAVTVELTAKKTLDGDGATLEDGQFEFTIKAKSPADAPMPANTTAKNDADGNISFGTASYTKEGTYVYEVTETKGSDSTITYDTTPKEITVKVTKKEAAADGEQETPNNGDNYLPKQHSTLSAGTHLKYDHGGEEEAGWFSTKSVTDSTDNTTENVFCGVSYKSGAEKDINNDQGLSRANGEVGWNDQAIIQGMKDYQKSTYSKWIDLVAFLYSYDWYSNWSSGMGTPQEANGAHGHDGEPVMTGDALVKAVKRVLYNGYPYNAAGVQDVEGLRKTTQEALFFVLNYGQMYKDGTAANTDGGYRDYAPNKEDFDAIVNYAIKDQKTKGYDLQDAPDKSEIYVYFTVGGWGNTEKTIPGWIQTWAFNPQPLIGFYAPWEAPAFTTEVTPAEFVNTKTSSENGGEEPSSTEPSIGTTIKVDGLQATPGTVRRVENGGSYPVVDTVAYTNFEAGSYTVEGKLIKVIDGKDAGVVAQGSSNNVEAKTAEGEWEIDFGQVELEDNAAYVAFETVKDADGNEVAKHEDINDMPQVVVSGEGWTEIWEDEPNFTPAKPTDPTEPTPTLKTTVSINDKAASETQARTVNASDASKVKNVRDHVYYEGFTANETYTLKAELIDAATGKAIANGTAEAPQTAEASEGEWTMDFTGVTIEPGHKYVVFEYAYDADGNEVAKHADVNDLAQTIVVTAKPTSAAASSTAKTADTAGVATLAALLVAVAAAGVGITARRKSEK